MKTGIVSILFYLLPWFAVLEDILKPLDSVQVSGKTMELVFTKILIGYIYII
jgi:hypothetical protein